jgi:hypothetical protein
MRNSKILAGVTIATPVLLAGEADGARLSAVLQAVDDATVARAHAQERLKRTLLKLNLAAKVRIAGDRLASLRDPETCQAPPPTTIQANTGVCPTSGQDCFLQGQVRPQQAGRSALTFSCQANCAPETQSPSAQCAQNEVATANGCANVATPNAHTLNTWGTTCGCAPTHPEVQTPRAATGDQVLLYSAACSPQQEVQPAPEEAQPEAIPPPAPRTRPSRMVPATAGCQ